MLQLTHNNNMFCIPTTCFNCGTKAPLQASIGNLWENVFLEEEICVVGKKEKQQEENVHQHKPLRSI